MFDRLHGPTKDLAELLLDDGDPRLLATRSKEPEEPPTKSAPNGRSKYMGQHDREVQVSSNGIAN